MKVSYSVALLLFSSVFSAPAANELTPVSEDDLNTWNSLLSSMVTIANAEMEQKLIDGKLDPLENCFQGTVSKISDLKVCTAMVKNGNCIYILIGYS